MLYSLSDCYPAPQSTSSLARVLDPIYMSHYFPGVSFGDIDLDLTSTQFH